MLNRVRIGPRLVVTFGLGLLALAGLALFALSTMRELNEKTQFFTVNIVPSLRLQHEMALELGAMRRAEVRYVLADAGQERKDLERQLSESYTRIGQAISQYANHYLVDAQDKAGLQATRQALDLHWQAWNQLRSVTLESSRSAVVPAVVRDSLRGDSLLSYQRVLDSLDGWWNYNMGLSDAMTAKAVRTYELAHQMMLGLLSVCLVLGILMAWAITRSVVVPIGQALRVAESAAQGDLTCEPVVSGSDEAADLLIALRKMNSGLSSMVNDVRETSQAIALGSAQIAHGNSDLSQRTDEQASSVEETARSMMEIRSAMARNADSAQASAQLADDVRTAAVGGGQLIRDVNGTMDTLVASTGKINEITAVIDDIAFQINILALNAAVEAARAGEQGRGFAVVASEVRTLARRSAESAKDIRRMIADCVEQVQTGARQVHKASGAIETIVSQVQQVAQCVDDISSSVASQRDAFTQISDAIAQLDQMTQQNAALVEESAVASGSLRDQAEVLNDLVGQFRLSNDAGASEWAVHEQQADAEPRSPVHSNTTIKTRRDDYVESI